MARRKSFSPARPCGNSRFPRPYVESLSDARTQLADFFSILSSELRLCDDFAAPVRPLDRHDMDAVAVRTHGLDAADRNVHADLFGLVASGTQFVDHCLWNGHAGDIDVHELRHFCVAQQQNASQYLDLERAHL